MKKNLNWAFTAIIMLLALSLAAGTLIAGPSKGGANEQLSAAPAWTDKDGNWNPDFLTDTMTWYTDHFFLRQELISAGNWLKANLLGTSGAEGVLVGKNGWLYYADTLQDYTGTNPLTQRELFCIANNLALLAEYAESTGREFLFAAAPNKNSLYPENMPQTGVTAQQTDAERLYALLEQMGVPYADLHAAFTAEEEVLYFAHDSHWNSKGAALAADRINAAFGQNSAYFTDNFSSAKPYNGDLYEMLYPAFADTETDPVYGGELSFRYTSGATSADSITLQTQGQGCGKLLAYRDSFGNLLYPYLADTYGEARFSRSPVYDLTLDADYVLIQLVERNLRYLITYLPVIVSPARDIAIPAEASGSTHLHYENRKAPEGYVYISGKVEAEPDTDSKVYVVCGGVLYEALLHKDGFAVYIPEGMTPEGVVYSVGGDYVLLTT